MRRCSETVKGPPADHLSVVCGLLYWLLPLSKMLLKASLLSPASGMLTLCCRGRDVTHSLEFLCLCLSPPASLRCFPRHLYLGLWLFSFFLFFGCCCCCCVGQSERCFTHSEVKAPLRAQINYVVCFSDGLHSDSRCRLMNLLFKSICFIRDSSEAARQQFVNHEPVYISRKRHS